MIEGRFGDTTGRPYVEGRLIIPRFGLEASISFLVDTGSDVTCLNPADGKRMKLDYGELGGHSESSGIGGIQYNYIEPAVLVFADEGRALYAYDLDLEVSPLDVDDELPSLLGRDVLDRWRMVYDPLQDKLTFTVRSADLRLPVG